ncbi:MULTISPECIES: HAD family acid phosphatase [unclassified Francisella]|uniref:HAD family acid phosphatase n=1 Tax=unclassified Francisella TaxID=2610885 RepID=UPI002E37CEC2|nr:MULTISPECIES: HAD family acid phosphatase [unclassified Francisella]MED7819116.1 HAD family acid phosphatase [Francisella sp. 19S2-4]MED7829924.1 HAD family acid phosphatase [Francisella sp. 19S2-10]
MILKKVNLALFLVVGASSSVFAVGCNPNVDGVKWYHVSAEKKALYYQAYNVASQKIKHEVKKDNLKKDTWGVILDIDETALDSYANEYKNYKDYKFKESMYNQADAIATPGAAKFTHLIHELGGYVSFVTNRGGNDKKEFDATVRNLKQQHIYFDQVLFSNEKDGKEQFNKNPRFNAVKTGEYNKDIILTNELPAHKVIAYFGDNIQDFPNLQQKNMQVADSKAYKEFGSKYFILPNPMYGSWQ